MSTYSILWYTILYYTILYCTILYYTILYYTILYYTILYYTILQHYLANVILYVLTGRPHRPHALLLLRPPLLRHPGHLQGQVP